jgi:dephospho-CoA kinase
MTYVVGLTGGIGSGKSVVAAMFHQLGAPIIDADSIAKDLVAKSQPAFEEIIQHFGERILKNAEINRALLREIIFNHPEEKQWLENLLHPKIYHTIAQRISDIHYAYCILVIPLLAEHYALYQPILDHIIVMDTSEALQLSRAVKRDVNDNYLVKKILLAQASREARLKIADTVLENNDSLATLTKNVADLDHYFLTKKIKL